MKLLGAELRVVDYAGDARLTECRYRKSQTKSRDDTSTDTRVRKQAGNFAIVIDTRVARVGAHAKSITKIDYAITELIKDDAIAVEAQRFASAKLTLLWLGDSSVVDTDTV